MKRASAGMGGAEAALLRRGTAFPLSLVKKYFAPDLGITGVPTPPLSPPPPNTNTHNQQVEDALFQRSTHTNTRGINGILVWTRLLRRLQL